MSRFSNFFSPTVIDGQTIQGTEFLNGKPVAGYVNGQFMRGNLMHAAMQQAWQNNPWPMPDMPPAAESAPEPTPNARGFGTNDQE